MKRRTRIGDISPHPLATRMDGVRSGYSAKTADPSTALRSGRDDKGGAVTFRRNCDSDGQNSESLSREDCNATAWLPSLKKVREKRNEPFLRCKLAALSSITEA